MTKKSISVRVYIPIATIESMLYGAYKGTSYWTSNDPDENNEITGLGLLAYEKEVKDFMEGDLVIYVFDGEDNDKKYELDIKKIKKGLTVLAKKYFHHISDIVEGSDDIYTADALIQCALLGDILYS